MSCEKVSMQIMSQTWAFHHSMLSKEATAIKPIQA